MSYDLCDSKFKSLDNLKRLDNIIHILNGPDTKFKRDFCNEICADKKRCVTRLKILMRNAHFLQNLQRHIMWQLKKGKPKHNIEKDSSMKNRKKKKKYYFKVQID